MFLGAILIMINECRVKGIFEVVAISANKVSESIKSELKDKSYQVTLTICGTDQHIEVIERMIRFLNKQIYVVHIIMPYKTIPKRFMIKMVHRIVVLINYLPLKG